MKNKNLIGIAGRRRSGKDTAALALKAEGYEVVKFAGPLKAMLYTYLEYIGVSGNEQIELIEGASKEIPTEYFMGRSPRYAMQTLGTEWGRELIHSKIWVAAAIAHANGFEKAVIADVRFPNEAAAIHTAGGVVLLIERPSLGGSDAHPSEKVDDLFPDFTIMNDTTIEALQQKVLALL